MHKNLRKIGQVVLEICLQTNRRTLCIPTEGRVTRTTTGGTTAVPAGSGAMPRLTPDATGSGGSKRVLRPDSSTRPNSCLARLRSCRSVWILHTQHWTYTVNAYVANCPFITGTLSVCTVLISSQPKSECNVQLLLIYDSTCIVNYLPVMFSRSGMLTSTGGAAKSTNNETVYHTSLSS